ATPSWWVVIAYYVAGAATVVWWRHRRRRGLTLAIAAASAPWIVAQPWSFVAPRGGRRRHGPFLDVRHGEAAWVRFPRGASPLFDAGGLTGSSFDVGERVVAPVLRDVGVRRLDCLVLTHGDPDHIGGAAAIVREFRPREVWEGIPAPRFEPLRVLRGE